MTPHPVPLFPSRAFAAAASAAALLLLTACGSAQPADAGADAETGDATRTIESAMGPVEVPERPERIVAVDYVSPEILFDLDAPLVGALDLSQGADGEKYTTITAVGNDAGELNFEQIAGLDPDVIIGNSVENEAVYDQLAAIAPTALFDSSGATDGPQWKATIGAVADIVNRVADVAAREQAYQDRVADLAGTYGSAIGAAGSWATIGTYDGVSWYAYGADTGPSTVLADLGAVQAPIADEVAADPNTMIRTLEELNALESAGVILFDDLGPPVTADGAAAALQADPLFAGLPATTAGRVFPGVYNVVTYGQAESVLDQLEALLGGL